MEKLCGLPRRAVGISTGSSMAGPAHRFDDGAAYEEFMARWSRSLGRAFLCWAAPPVAAHWLDVGCGTGILTELILQNCQPSTVSGVDCSEAQIDYACRRGLGNRAELRVADAQDLPFPNQSFDVVASCLVVNFVADPSCAMSEMRRVARQGGLVIACVWDFSLELSPSWPLRAALRRIGAGAPPVPGTSGSSLSGLTELFEHAGLGNIETSHLDIVAEFNSFDELWRSLTSGCAPTTRLIADLPDSLREELRESVQRDTECLPNGLRQYRARANAIKARKLD